MINDGFLLFRNLGEKDFFEDRGGSSDLLMATRQFTGWGLGMFDLDNDGWKDLFFALAHFNQLDRYLGRDSALPNRVFHNRAGRSFEDVSASAGAAFQLPAYNRGVAFADFDNDGRVDAVVSVLNGPAKLFRNLTPATFHWLGVKLNGTQSNRQGLGARITLQLPDGRTLSNHATTSVGYASSSEPIVRFGMGENQMARRMEIHWPGGAVQELFNIPADRVVEVKQK